MQWLFYALCGAMIGYRILLEAFRSDRLSQRRREISHAVSFSWLVALTQFTIPYAIPGSMWSIILCSLAGCGSLILGSYFYFVETKKVEEDERKLEQRTEILQERLKTDEEGFFKTIADEYELNG